MRASVDERTAALQSVEDFFAREQGRASRTVTRSALGNGVAGEYRIRQSDRIFISSESLEDDSASFDAMDTVIHEGRHAYQDDCIMWLCAPHTSDIPKVSGWRKNMPGRGGVYFASGFMNRFQPIEADAYGYAGLIMDALRDASGGDPNYAAYRINRDSMDNQLTAEAIRAVGEDFMETVELDVGEGQMRSILAGLGTVRDGAGGFNTNGGGYVEISVAELVAKIVTLQKSSALLSEMIANASQELAKQRESLVRLTRGSRSGEQATLEMQVSSQSLSRAAAAMNALCLAGDRYIENATK